MAADPIKISGKSQIPVKLRSIELKSRDSNIPNPGDFIPRLKKISNTEKKIPNTGDSIRDLKNPESQKNSNPRDDNHEIRKSKTSGI